MNNLYKTLSRYKKKRIPFSRTEEYSFFISNHLLLNKIPRFTYLDNMRADEFQIMRANIIIHSYLNKTLVEEEMENFANYQKQGEVLDHVKLIQTLREKMVDQPYFLDGKEKIYIPFFSRTLNQLYNYDPEKLLSTPYSDLKNQFADSVIDPFDTYGAELFNSNFTRLLKLKSDGKITAFFHYDTNTIYFINDEGRLDNKIVLFDRYIKHPHFSHMLDRIEPVIDAYFRYDRAGLINALHDNELISSRLLYIIHRKGEKK